MSQYMVLDERTGESTRYVHTDPNDTRYFDTIKADGTQKCWRFDADRRLALSHIIKWHADGSGSQDYFVPGPDGEWVPAGGVTVLPSRNAKGHRVGTTQSVGQIFRPADLARS